MMSGHGLLTFTYVANKAMRFGREVLEESCIALPERENKRLSDATILCGADGITLEETLTTP